MKIMRSIGFCIGMALACFARSLWRLVEPVAHYVASGCEDLSSGVEKLYRELTYNASRSGVGAGVSSGFRRESNGYRQTQADEYDGFASAT